MEKRRLLGFLWIISANRDASALRSTCPVRSAGGDYGTPLYVYSKATLLHHLQPASRRPFAPSRSAHLLQRQDHGNLALCRLMAENGSGFDVTSGGELFRAMDGRRRGDNIVFAGVGKTDAEFRYALENDLFLSTSKSEDELHALATQRRRWASRPLWPLRVQSRTCPPKTHVKTDTSVKGVKFGLDIETILDVARGVLGNPGVRIVGLHMHLVRRSSAAAVPRGGGPRADADRTAAGAGPPHRRPELGAASASPLP